MENNMEQTTDCHFTNVFIYKCMNFFNQQFFGRQNIVIEVPLADNTNKM